MKDGKMKFKTSKLILKQLDKKLHTFQSVQHVEAPDGGWISTIRKTLNMSLRQLGSRLSVTPQGMKKIEANEKEGGISLNALRQAGEALNLKLVYGFIPTTQTLEQMIEARAADMARNIVMRTSTNMKLEDQENSSQRLDESIEELTNELKREMPKSLWD
jgi:predicted DNA-binding mobile mystery protein A